MLNFLMPKTKVQSYNFKQVPIEGFEIIGIGQINPYCDMQYDNEKFLTVINFINVSRRIDEKETLALSQNFTYRRCPVCKKVELIPIKIVLNLDSIYQKNEEEVAFDAYSEQPSRTNTPSIVKAYCNNCSSCFEFRIKTKDLWIKEAKKLKAKDLVIPWEEYLLDTN